MATPEEELGFQKEMSHSSNNLSHPLVGQDWSQTVMSQQWAGSRRTRTPQMDSSMAHCLNLSLSSGRPRQERVPISLSFSVTTLNKSHFSSFHNYLTLLIGLLGMGGWSCLGTQAPNSITFILNRRLVLPATTWSFLSLQSDTCRVRLICVAILIR